MWKSDLSEFKKKKNVSNDYVHIYYKKVKLKIMWRTKKIGKRKKYLIKYLSKNFGLKFIQNYRF
jgi:hypothetical protein